MNHGELGDSDIPEGHPDPELLLVFADLSQWVKDHPCECEALCTCDEGIPETAFFGDDPWWAARYRLAGEG